MKYAAWAALALMAFVLVGCSSDSNIKEPHELTAITPTLQVDRMWTSSVGRGAGASGVRMRPAYDDGVVYVAAYRGAMKAIDAQSGATLWQKRRPWKSGHDVKYSGGPAVSQGVLFIGTQDGNVYALEAKNGDQLWQASVNSSVLSRPVITDRYVVLHLANGNVTALNRADGSRAWLYDQAEIPSLSLRGSGNLVIAHGVVFFGTDAGRLVAIRLDNGDELWRHRLASGKGRTAIERLDDADGMLVLEGSHLYAAAYHGDLTAVDARGGRPLWSQPFSSYVGLAVAGTTLVGIDDASNVWAWSTNSGGNLWKQEDLSWRWLSPPAIQEEHVIVGDREGYVHWLDLSDGSLAARTRMTHDPIRSKPLVLDDGQVIVEDAKGHIASWKVTSR